MSEVITMLENQKLLLLEDLGMLFPTEKSKIKYRYGLYLCQCGNEFKAITANVKKGHTTSCGCHRIASAKKCHTTHGMTKHPLNSVINNMLKRCTNPKHKDFVDYGARGIRVCPEWANNRKAFFDWSLANGYREGLTIDRIKNDGIYEPSNCRWTTMEVQARNKRVLMVTNSSGYRGVSWHKLNKKWIASIRAFGKLIYLGSFNTALEAAQKYDNYVLSHNLEHTINGMILK